MIISLSISCCILFIGCAGNNKTKIQEKLMTMSDAELINHYKMLEMRMIDIDRNREQSLEQEHDLYGRHYPGDGYNHLGHLHIADDWNALKKEKKLTQWEMKKRGLLPIQ
jgi:ferritin-like protein